MDSHQTSEEEQRRYERSLVVQAGLQIVVMMLALAVLSALVASCFYFAG
ncbi:hypothetical protein GT347_13385 [Xylophilus rhododendri]|uniref:Uncharacterized protein n=1 Tax=Xylophilus rhododendri TaxID=2697032 RepID=A0A857J4K5_9BURK|nr:hypothetical protein [Xylophilus rhododendri]QHI98894.1 hypothetical protein GT347_13385 [Xylophilus rhododendri]